MTTTLTATVALPSRIFSEASTKVKELLRDLKR
jgi:hypothetical protein